MAAGSISPSEFLNQVKLFINISVKNRDTWQLIVSHHDESEVYLCQRVTKNVVLRSRENTAKPQADLDEICEHGIDEDNLCTIETSTISTTETEAVNYEYHIVYSCSYAVPVLYFTASDSKGKLLSLEDVWSLVPDYYQERLKQERWTFLTQQEHPILGRPFFQLHPCYTVDLMKQINRKQNYLITWLSTIGPVVGLNLPLNYGAEST